MNFQRCFIYFAFSILFCGGCVSVKLEEKKVQHSEDVQFSDPGKLFEKQETRGVDHLWQNPKNGNTISFLSDCNNESDPTLENIQKGIVSEIEDLETLQTNPIEFNGREGLQSIADGKVDGVPSRLELVIFKKHSCIYIITYASVAKTYGENQRVFQKFLKGFVVP